MGPVLTLLPSLKGFLLSSLHSQLSSLTGDTPENLLHVRNRNFLQTLGTWQKRRVVHCLKPVGLESHVLLQSATK